MISLENLKNSIIALRYRVSLFHKAWLIRVYTIMLRTSTTRIRHASAWLRVIVRNKRAEQKCRIILEPSEVVQSMEVAEFHASKRGRGYDDEAFLEDMDRVGNVIRCRWVEADGSEEYHIVDSRQLPRKLQMVIIDEYEQAEI